MENLARKEEIMEDPFNNADFLSGKVCVCV